MDPAVDAASIGFDHGIDPDLVKKTLSSHPFVDVEGIVNMRHLPFRDDSPAARLIFRSGELGRITDKGREQLQALGVKKVFDLRAQREVDRMPDPLDGTGIDVIHVPAFVTPRADDFKETFARFGSGDDVGFLSLYQEVLDEGGPAIRRILEHIRDHLASGEGILFHCTGGKDRTGVVAMLLLDLVGTSEDSIVRDYALTRIGLEPARLVMAPRFAKLLEDPELAAATLHGFSSPPSAMRATLAVLKEKYGGAEGYLKSEAVGFDDEDIAKLRAVLI